MKKEDFILKKVKTEKNQITIDYTWAGSAKEFTEKSNVVPHPDLKNALAKFIPLAVEVFNMPEENEEFFVVNGIVLNSKKDSEMVMVLLSFTTESGAKVAINTPLISLDTSIWPAQEKLGEHCDDVVEECYAYLFTNKAAQLQADFGEENKNEE